MAARHTQLTSISVLLQWSPPPNQNVNGIIRAYEVIVSEQETGRNYNLTSTRNELSVGNLHPFYRYSFAVSAITIAQGPFTELYSLQTLEDGKCINYGHLQISYINAVNFLSLISCFGSLAPNLLYDCSRLLHTSWIPEDIVLVLTLHD